MYSALPKIAANQQPAGGRLVAFGFLDNGTGTVGHGRPSIPTILFSQFRRNIFSLSIFNQFFQNNHCYSNLVNICIRNYFLKIFCVSFFLCVNSPMRRGTTLLNVTSSWVKNRGRGGRLRKQLNANMTTGRFGTTSWWSLLTVVILLRSNHSLTFIFDIPIDFKS